MTSPSNVLIVGIPSFSPPKNKNSLRLKAMITIPNAVPTAVRQGKQSATEAVATIDPNVKCFLQYAPSAVRTPKCHSGHVKIDPYIVAIATARLE